LDAADWLRWDVAMGSGLTISPVRSADDGGFATVLAVDRADSAERNPGDPLRTASVLASDLLLAMPDFRRLILAADIDGEPVGSLNAVYRTEPDGENWSVDIEVTVLAAWRRQGIATALVDRALPQLADIGPRLVLAYPALDLWADEAVGLCERYGLTKRSEERCSRALVDDVDDALLDDWIAAAATTASAYRIESWQGPCPEELLAAWCTAAAAMEDAPTDDMDFDEHIRDPEGQRAADEVCVQRGLRMYRSLVRTDDGEPAGISDLYVYSELPEVGHQGDTGVLAAHRGHGLGRWLKAVNLRQAVAAHPELRVIETYNAQSNPWMLDINVAMGFQPHHVYGVYQGPIVTAMAATTTGS
jgi:GNAT superfamily N-acetyltransferase